MSDQGGVNAEALAREIEPQAIASWPARETMTLHGWLLRFTNGFTHRGNSVATLHFVGTDLPEAVETVEREYRRRALRPMFQIASSVAPSDLATSLLARGYQVVTPTLVLVGSPVAIGKRLPDGTVKISREPDEDFVSLVLEGSRSIDDGRERIDILWRIPHERICVTASSGGKAVACGMGTLTNGYVAINMMRTTTAHRRRGYARRVLAAIARWAGANGAKRLYLSVETANAPAIALYERAGFGPGYDYCYYREST
jgi:N-acetylglutamate synthase